MLEHAGGLVNFFLTIEGAWPVRGRLTGIRSDCHGASLRAVSNQWVFSQSSRGSAAALPNVHNEDSPHRDQQDRRAA